jgi:hypothetical protein
VNDIVHNGKINARDKTATATRIRRRLVRFNGNSKKAIPFPRNPPGLAGQSSGLNPVSEFGIDFCAPVINASNRRKHFK